MHPDLFMNNPEIKQLNEDSFSKLQGFLSAFKDASNADYPPAGATTMKFMMRNPDRDGNGPEFKSVSFHATVWYQACRLVCTVVAYDLSLPACLLTPV